MLVQPTSPIYIPSRTWQTQQLLLHSQWSCGAQEVGRGKHTCRGSQTCARAAAVQPDTDAQPGARSIAARMPHTEVWELFCDARKAAGAFEQSSACVPKATDIITRIERIVAKLAATVASTEGQESILRSMKHHMGELPEPMVPIESELDLAAFYKDIKTSPLPELVPPLRAGLSDAEQAVFPSCNNPGSTFKGWGTLASPDDLHVRPHNALYVQPVVLAVQSSVVIFIRVLCRKHASSQCCSLTTGQYTWGKATPNATDCEET